MTPRNRWPVPAELLPPPPTPAGRVGRDFYALPRAVRHELLKKLKKGKTK